jgi:hypothetical protein
VPQLRGQQFLPGQTEGLGAAGESDDDAARPDTGAGTAEHGGCANFFEGKQPKELAKTWDGHIQEGLDGFGGHIPLTKTRPPRDQQHINLGFLAGGLYCCSDCRDFITHNDSLTKLVTRGL